MIASLGPAPSDDELAAILIAIGVAGEPNTDCAPATSQWKLTARREAVDVQ